MTETPRLVPVPPASAAPDERSVPLRGRTAARAVRWGTLSVLGRQGSQILFALLVARLLGPGEYGVISAATVYVTFTALLLDQGISAALVQRGNLDRAVPGAAATINLAMGVVIGALTWVCAPAVGGFFASGALVGVLQWLAIGVIAKAAAIAPRAMLLRGLRLRSVAVADIAGAGLGAIAGLVAAYSGSGPMALVFLTLVGDGVTALLLLVGNRGPTPNLRLGAFVPLIRFGASVFLTNGIAYFSRNSDNVLIGRFLGTTALSYYSMGYRVLVIPVQFIGQSVNRVMFPAFSRAAHDRALLAEYLVKATELLAIVTIPVMTLLAVASHHLVLVVLGDRWLPAAPLMSVLALAGARETLFYVTPALIRATGAGSLNLRFELLSTAVQVVGIVIGLRFGVLGVAVGYATAGLLLTPLLLVIQQRLTGVRMLWQLAALWPPLHASLWAALAFVLLARFTERLAPLLGLLCSGTAFLLVLAGVLALVHPRVWRSAWRRLGAVAGLRGAGSRRVSA